MINIGKSHSRQKPIVLQMPITSKCNSRCQTCNIWKYKENKDIDAESLREILHDPFFSEVESVGLNGGEFTLNTDFINVVKSVLTLPKLSSVFLISNGLYPKKLFEYLQEAKILCDARNVSLCIGISVDGVGSVHENIRGVPNCFTKTKEILDGLYLNREKYCSYFSVICTLSKNNIAYIRETEKFLNQYKGMPVEFQLAVPNLRIRTFDDYDKYFVLSDKKAKSLAMEFFHEQFKTSTDERIKRQSFVIYNFLKKDGKGRLCKCNYFNRDVTIDENLNMSLCATASRVVGNLKEKKPAQIIDNSNTKQERNRIKKLCNTCIHYSENPLTLKGRFVYINDIIYEKYIYQWFEVASLNRIQRIKRWPFFIKHLVYDYLKLLYIYIWRLL